MSAIDMEFPQPLRPKSTLALIFQVGVLNALLATLMAAAAFALISGAGIEQRIVTIGIGTATQRNEWSYYPNLWGLTEAVLWISPFTAVSCGWFGLLAGLVGGVFMCIRGPHVTSRRFLIETSILGLPLACLFPPLDTWINGPLLPLALYLLAVVLGPVCAFVCALAFHQRSRVR